MALLAEKRSLPWALLPKMMMFEDVEKDDKPRWRVISSNAINSSLLEIPLLINLTALVERLNL